MRKLDYAEEINLDEYFVMTKGEFLGWCQSCNCEISSTDRCYCPACLKEHGLNGVNND